MMKRLHTQSQNFLRNPMIVKTLLGHSTIKKSDTVLDIGAGSGVISAILAENCERVVAIESEPRVAEKLRQNMRNYPNVEIVQKSILDIDLPHDSYKVFSNIPFHLSSPIIRKLTEAEQPPTATYLIVQKQFAKKLLIGGDSFTGLLGAFIAPLFTTRIRYRLERTDFFPAPAVETVMVELLLRDTPLIQSNAMPAYRAFVEHCFSRQKYFATLGVNKRPSELTTDEWIALFTRQKTK